MQAVVEEYGPHSPGPIIVEDTIEALNIIETAILDGKPPNRDDPIYLRCGPVVFFLDVGEPWPTITQDAAHLVHMLILLTIAHDTATGIDSGIIRRNHGSPRSLHENVAIFMVGLSM